MRNELAGDIGLAAGKSQYDAYCKRILANKVILAWILRYSVKEFAHMRIAEIKKCIGDDIQISKVRVSPGMTNTPEPEKISGGAQEDKVPGEGEVYYDIRFSVYLPGQKEKVKMIINVEAQKDSYPGYEIPSRGIYYGARMISAQKGTEFSGSDYDRIKKVYSIWICMNAPDHIGNAVSEYSIVKKDHIPGIPDRIEAYDKLTVVQICLNPKSKKGNRLTEMLNILFSVEMKAGEKMRKLEQDFHIPMEQKIEKELNQMCNLSDYVVEVGLKKGMEQGMEQGMKEGMKQGIKQGMEQGVEQGLERGRLLQQIEVIQKKIRKGKSLEQTADEMEEERGKIEPIYRMIWEEPQSPAEVLAERILCAAKGGEL